ncbi:nicotinamide riboside transporter PnuC [Aquirufa sp. ROCK-SH2]
MTFFQYLSENWIEIAGIISSILGVYFSIQQKSIAWLWNIIASLLFGLLFFQIGLYSDAELQGFFILMAVFGWIKWAKNSEEWIPENSSKKEIAAGLLFTICFGLISGFLHQSYSQNVSLPYLDASLTGLSIWGTWLAARKKTENWYVWIIADTIYVGMYIQKGLIGTSILYLIFIALAVKGLISWKKKQEID